MQARRSARGRQSAEPRRPLARPLPPAGAGPLTGCAENCRSRSRRSGYPPTEARESRWSRSQKYWRAASGTDVPGLKADKGRPLSSGVTALVAASLVSIPWPPAASSPGARVFRVVVRLVGQGGLRKAAETDLPVSHGADCEPVEDRSDGGVARPRGERPGPDGASQADACRSCPAARGSAGGPDA